VSGVRMRFHHNCSMAVLKPYWQPMRQAAGRQAAEAIVGLAEPKQKKRMCGKPVNTCS
jgi:hypothetical protein